MLNKPATAAEIETATFKSATVSIGNGNTVLLQRSSMVHVLQNHHPLYWDQLEKLFLILISALHN